MPAAAVPETRSLRRLREAAQRCQACDLYRDATQTVFGAGRPAARIMLVGEQPGDVEDRDGRPFVGPAGRLLDRALADAGVPRADLYLTNAVKHFKFSRQAGGKRRIHEKPDAGELAACRPWLGSEVLAVRPRVIVLLGATAAATVLGPGFRVTAQRGRPLPWPEVGGRSPLIDGRTPALEAALQDALVVATVHPSAVLRSRERDTAYAAFAHDLGVLAGLGAAP